MYEMVIYLRCVLKNSSLSPFGFIHFNHLVHNKTIKLSKWQNYFCGINDVVAVAAKLLQSLKLPGWRKSSPLCRKLWFCCVDTSERPGKVKVIKPGVIICSIFIVHRCQREKGQASRLSGLISHPAYLPVSELRWLEPVGATLYLLSCPSILCLWQVRPRL